MTSNVELVAVADIRPYCAGEPDLRARVARAMARAQEFWLSTDDALRFRAAVAAAWAESPPDDVAVLERSARRAAGVLTALASGTMSLEEPTGDDGPVIPLLGMWMEAKEVTPHWTDHAAEPVFSTVIYATGSKGNILVILGTACAHLRQLDVPGDRIRKLSEDVARAASYDQAVAFVERWFRVDRGEG